MHAPTTYRPVTWGDLAHHGTWISIYRQPKEKGRKTDLFVVVSTDGATVLADIRWYAPWRAYVLVPRPGTIWECTCRTEVGLALGDLTAAYKRRSV